MKFNIFSSANTIIWALLIFLTPLCAYFMFISKLTILEWEILSSNPPIIFNLIFDKVGLSFSWVVLFISANVLSFSKIYIYSDINKNRFTIIVIIFIFSINILIYIPHIIVLLLGWDGLGLTSFILVIYYQNQSSLAARIITALTNRLGDVAILMAIGLSINQGHWLLTNIHQSNILWLQVILIIFAAITKRAQIPFSSWLPAAIAAPTPVSALVHSSTLVTAGVFLLIRFHPTLKLIPIFTTLLLIVATTTTFIAGMSATIECDLKKIIALSTLSQLGIIIFRLGINIPWLAYFHIITHAIFKALLFICVGSIIHFHIHSQDLRWMGNIHLQKPTIISSIIIANLALCGFPFSAGFYSKDIIIEAASEFYFCFPLIIISLIRLILTSLYSIRATLAPIVGPISHNPFNSLSEPINITSATILLAILAISLGSILSWTYPMNLTYFTIRFISKLMPTASIFVGVLTGLYLTTKLITSNSILLSKPLLHEAITKIWFLIPLSTQFIFKLSIFITINSLKTIDQGYIEFISGQGFIITIKINTNYSSLISPLSVNQFILISTITTITIISLNSFIYFSSLY